MIQSGTVFIKKIKTIFDEVSEMEFVWQMKEDDWKDYVNDHKANEGACELGSYGEVFFGKYCMEFLHTLDESDWYPYTSIYEIGKDTGYGYTDQDVPYDLIPNEIRVPIDLLTFEGFKGEVEKRVKAMVEQEGLQEKANAPTEADRW